ncbi:MAG: SIMPL domain-containing protein [Hydrogenophaga sp.]|uniref:SIMPL domain-containing protein n=1 Tax=Hydrogenophaga sp. TaxID=1904254 RepID=UPI001D652968|nr:SIMPL domain-containing protein [Hydrogenophaga sp.]MBX3609764.1 SIMPL domain-containing protein [Hydrogenophaga sp.]
MKLASSGRRVAIAWRGLALSAVLFATCWSPAQAQINEVPSNIVSLQASGHMEVPQDWLTIVLSTTKEGADPATVQNQLKVAMDAALATAQAQAKPQQLEVRSGNLRLYPRYASGGRISGWQGQAELIIEGRDLARVSEVAGRIQSMTVSNMGFSLSRDARRALESQVQAQAIERFRARASEVAKGFGFASYALREVNVSSADMPDRGPVPRVMAMEAKAASSDMPIPTAAGTATVSVTVSGSIQLR